MPVVSTRSGSRTKTRFIEGSAGRLHQLYAEPASNDAARGIVLVVPPFDEEANRSRRTLVALVRALASRGDVALLTDHFGTGDSAGDFEQARWAIWVDDLCDQVASALVIADGAPVRLVAMRAGCLLVDSLPDSLLDRLSAVVLLARELSRQALLRRWLMGEAARRRFTGEPGASVAALQQSLQQGDTVFVAGLGLHPLLAEALQDEPTASVASLSGERSIKPVVRQLALRPCADDAPDTLHTASFWTLEACPLDRQLVARLADEIERRGYANTADPVAVRQPVFDRPVPKPSVDRARHPWSRERAIGWQVAGHAIHGVTHGVAKPTRLGAIVIVGGAQYRVGAHRQFVDLARSLASRGVPTLRFDLVGMGDAEGEPRHFLHNATDIDAALAIATTGQARIAERVVLWGLCDGASASVVHAADAMDARIAGVVLVNPWVRTESGAARTRLRHYYGTRLGSAAFIRKLIRGQVDLSGALRSLFVTLKRASGFVEPANDDEPGLPDLVLDAVEACPVPVLIVVASADETAREFEAVFDARSGRSWPSVDKRVVAGNHTFSDPDDRKALEALTTDWVLGLDRGG